MRALDLPLSVKDFTCSHAALRRSCPFPPLPLQLAQMVPGNEGLPGWDLSLVCEPLDCVLQFEDTSKWPDDLMAIARIKSAFLIQLARLLSAKPARAFSQPHGNASHPLRVACGMDYLDIGMPPGLVFRVRILHVREVLRPTDDRQTDRQADS